MDYLEATMQVLSSLYMDIVKGGYQNERKKVVTSKEEYT